jgi:RNA polymerase sigma-70 factor (ECF subfamily)
MASEASDTTDLLRRAGGGDAQAVTDLFARYHNRLRRMVRLRLDRRLHGRVDPSEVLRQACADAVRRAGECATAPAYPFFLWLRLVTGQRLQALHQELLGPRMGEAGHEVSLYRGALPQANSLSLAAQLLGRLATATPAEELAEKQFRLQEALNNMDALDREILALRHFEELSNDESAEVLGIDRAAASNLYIRALKRLKDVVSRIPGFLRS